MVNTLDMQDLHKALKAYKQAEKNPSTSFNPDLHFNRAMVLFSKFLIIFLDSQIFGKLF